MPARLTIPEFMAELKAKTEREGIEWHLTPIGRIQWTDGLGRRLCALAFWTEEPDGYVAAAKRRGMSKDDILAIINANDNFTSGVPGLRAQLLAATGVA